LIQPTKKGRRSSLHDEDADVAIEQKLEGHSEALDRLGSRVWNLVGECVVCERRKIG
jgi:hypothetical protein